MSGLFDALLALVVIGLVITRQLRPRQVSGGRRWWLIPGVLMVLAVREGGLVDPAHQEASIALLCTELALSAGIGAVWMQTTRIWAEPDGTVWAQGTRASIAVWAAGVAMRVGLYAAGAAMGVEQKTGSVLLAVGLALFVRSGLLVWRAQGVGTPYRTVA